MQLPIMPVLAIVAEMHSFRTLGIAGIVGTLVMAHRRRAPHAVTLNAASNAGGTRRPAASGITMYYPTVGPGKSGPVAGGTHQHLRDSAGDCFGGRQSRHRAHQSFQPDGGRGAIRTDSNADPHPRRLAGVHDHRRARSKTSPTRTRSRLGRRFRSASSRISTSTVRLAVAAHPV